MQKSVTLLAMAHKRSWTPMTDKSNNTEGVTTVNDKLAVGTTNLGVLNRGLVTGDEDPGDGGGEEEGRGRSGEDSEGVALEDTVKTTLVSIIATPPEYSVATSNYDEDPEEKDTECWGQRHTLALLGFLSNAISYSHRTVISIAIVAMAGRKGTSEVNHTITARPDTCPLPAGWNETHITQIEGEFDWDEQTQGMMIGYFFWGYATSNVLGGRLAEVLGGRLVLGIGIILTSFFTILCPFCAYTSKGIFIAVRVIMGISQGMTYSAMGTMLVAWVSPKERGTFLSIVLSGMQLGILASLALGGLLIESGFLGGWPSTFYVFGAIGLVWSIPWFILVRDRPEEHPNISRSELRYIKTHTSSIKTTGVVKVPWVKIMTSPAAWATNVANMGSSYTMLTMVAGIPSYLSDVEHMDVENNGLLSSLPYVAMVICTFCWAAFTDRLLKADVVSTLTVRRLSTMLGSYVPSASMISLCFVRCNPVLTMVVLCISIGCMGPAFCGFHASSQDIAPNLTGTLMGVANTMGSVMAFVGPAVLGTIIEGNPTIKSWRIVFIITSVVSFTCGTFYLIFVKAEPQPWNYPEPKISQMEARNNIEEDEPDQRTHTNNQPTPDPTL
ncbi:sialin-like [Homarus americanus]|uniref:sialin-like n=1 Tax=Homarus americanus TaxID=6706 RepID=UPI001C49518A|nr:sialin-like [Homarus americanus]